MRTIFLLLPLLMFSLFNLPSYAEGGLEDIDGSVFENRFDGQKVITEKEYQDALKQKQGKPKKKKIKNIEDDPNVTKEQDLYSEMQILHDAIHRNPQFVLTFDIVDMEDNIIPMGHYDLKCIQNGGKPELLFLQGRQVLGKIKARATEDESMAKNRVIYADCAQVDEKMIKIIFANLDNTFEGFALIKP